MTEDSVSVVHVTCNKIMFPGLFFFFGGGGVEILRDINGHDHQTSMARISISIFTISTLIAGSQSTGGQ